MKKIINPAFAAVEFHKGERIAYLTNGQGKLAILRTVKAGYPEGEPRYAFFYEDRSTGPDNGKFLHFSAAGAIREAVKAGRRVFVQELVPVAEVRESGEVPPEDPKPVLVPLGDNVTRDGRKVRVICNDRKDHDGLHTFSVVALVTEKNGHELFEAFYWDGRALDDRAMDLVGHLPPEPPKPRELWLSPFGGYCMADEGKPIHPDSTLFREVDPAKDELEHLRRLRAENLQVEASWDVQAVGRELGLVVGQDIRPNILPGIQKLKARIAELESR